MSISLSGIKSSTKECSRCLVGKIYGGKVNFAGLKNTLSLLWSFVGPMKIRERWSPTSISLYLPAKVIKILFRKVRLGPLICIF